MKGMKRAAVLVIVLVMCIAGCDVYTSGTVATFDTNAASARNAADAANAGQTSQPAMAYQLECFAETFQNLSDAGHWRQPTFTAAPTTVPTTLPWTPNPQK
jgi:hypothetical protein